MIFSPHNSLCAGPNDPNLDALGGIWKPFIPSSQRSTFAQLGSYLTYVSPNIAAISLNTLSMFAKNKCDSGCHNGQYGDSVLSWLHSVLQQLASDGVGVYISGHIPPTTDYWHNKCVEKYSNLASKYNKTILGHLFAHTHQDNFAILQDPTTTQPIAVATIAPSVLSSYNPSVRQYFYNINTGAILDYTQYYANLTQINTPPYNLVWQKEYSWRHAYGYNSYSVSNWADLSYRISNNATVASQYIKYRYVSSGLTQFLCSKEKAELGACVLHVDKYHSHP